MSQLKETCNLLDDTLVEYFETLELVSEKQEELNNCMRDGFLLMAKVRYYDLLVHRLPNAVVNLLFLLDDAHSKNYQKMFAIMRIPDSTLSVISLFVGTLQYGS